MNTTYKHAKRSIWFLLHRERKLLPLLRLLVRTKTSQFYPIRNKCCSLAGIPALNFICQLNASSDVVVGVVHWDGGY